MAEHRHQAVPHRESRTLPPRVANWSQMSHLSPLDQNTAWLTIGFCSGKSLPPGLTAVNPGENGGFSPKTLAVLCLSFKLERDSV